MTKNELRMKLESGASLCTALNFSIGQCGCSIYKSSLAEATDDPESICYVPDMELNEIPYWRENLSDDAIEDMLDQCYTFREFIELCNGDFEKSKIVFMNCDWQHPSTEYAEMNTIGWNDEEDNEQPWHSVTRWCADDVVGIANSAGIEMTIQQAEEWWKEHENDFLQALVQAGNEILESMI